MLRYQPAVHSRNHDDVDVAELARDELERHARTDHADGPVMPGVMQPVTEKTERAESLPVRISRVPARQPAEEPLARHDGREAL
ncbi:MAG: hypothetical protein M3068_12820 [Gemmatimonadota bacterium]|nr:hypothetical protein [Gemmatimonadota bacterium]